jgi:CheY-like chemotaxis protein
MALRCLLVDDSLPFQQAATSLLEREGVAVVGVASSVTEALRRVEELRPNLVLVDVMLGVESGLYLAQLLAELEPDGFQVILISTYAEEDLADLIEQAPVTGFLPKSDLSANAIQRLLRDGKRRPPGSAPLPPGTGR